MALPSSGQISLGDLQGEFGGTNPISITEYYRGEGLVPDITANNAIPLSGVIKLSDFYNGSINDPSYIRWENVTSPTTVNVDSFMGSTTQYGNGDPRIWITPNEDKISFLAGGEQKIRIANFNTPGDITQGFTLQNTSPTLPAYFRDHMYNPTGTKVFGLIQTGLASPVINFSEYSISTPFDISTISPTFTSKIDLNTEDIFYSATFNSDGTELIMIFIDRSDNSTTKFLVYALSTPYSLSSSDSGTVYSSSMGSQGWIFNFANNGNEYLLGEASTQNFIYKNGYTIAERIDLYSSTGTDLVNAKFALDRDKIYGSYYTYTGGYYTYYLQKFGYSV
jgi:hypothetical protein